jgi:DNA-binding NtrC family response regulator
VAAPSTPGHWGSTALPRPPAQSAIAASNAPRLEQRREAAKREEVECALAQTNGNLTRVARLLGISRRTLVSRLTKYGPTQPRSRPDDGEPGGVGV